MNGPDAPDLTLQELDREVILMLSYRDGSNNKTLEYQEVDPLITATNNTYKFEGFQIFQLANASASVGDRYDPSQARLVAQCDIKNGVARLVNWELDPDLDLTVPQNMTLQSSNGGIKMSFRMVEDAFATGQDRRLVNHKEYHYTIVAYAYNEFKKYDPTATPDGQRRPFLAGRNNVKKYIGIPHRVQSEAGGTAQNSQYGFQPIITRIEGLGNSGNVLRLDEATEMAIITNGSIPNPTYLSGFGPINIKVVDPLNVPDGDYTLALNGVGANARWAVLDVQGDTIAKSMTTIKFVNEQLIPELGLSVQLQDVEAPGDDPTNLRNAGILTSDIVYDDPTRQWFSGVKDDDSYSPYNWILVGNESSSSAPGKYFHDIGGDTKNLFEGILEGRWAPFYYVSLMGRGVADVTNIYGMGPADSTMQVALRLTPANLHGVDVVFTKDPSKWTRVPVFEMGDDENLTQGNQKKFRLRKAMGYDLSNGQLVSGAHEGWSYFPGYAIDVETGTRLNLAFAENSWMVSDNGADMKFNPTSRQRIFPQDNVTGGYRFGGQHYLYVFAPSVRKGVSTVDLTYQGSNPTDHPLYAEINNLNLAVNRTTFTKSLMWVTLPLMDPAYTGVDLYTQMPSGLRVRLRVARPYEKYVTDNSNSGNPKYKFNTTSIATGLGIKDSAVSMLDQIRVVPNPYFSQSAYETSQIDNFVKLTNLPMNCSISIYTTDGSLVRSLKKDNTDAWMYWDLKNNYGVPIASGVYIIHIKAEYGEKIIKFFGTMRPFDPTGF